MQVKIDFSLFFAVTPSIGKFTISPQGEFSLQLPDNFYGDISFEYYIVEQTENEFKADLENNVQKAFDPLQMLMGNTPPPCAKEPPDKTRTLPCLYGDDYEYLKAAILYLDHTSPLQADFVDDRQQVTLTAGKELKDRLKYVLPKEVWPEKNSFILSTDPALIQKEISLSRKDEKAWPRVHYLWPLNPLVEWINDKVIAGFGRQEAPVLSLHGVLAPGEIIFIISGLIPNRKSHPLVHRWFGVVFKADQFVQIQDFQEILTRTGLGKTRFPNPEAALDPDHLNSLLPEAVKQARHYMGHERDLFEDMINPKLNDHLVALEQLKSKQYRQLNLFYESARKLDKKDQEKREIDRVFDEFMEWVQDTMSTENNPYIQVIAVLRGV